MPKKVVMSEEGTVESSIAKSGRGERLFLAFLGRSRQSEDPPQLSAKSDPSNDLVGVLMLLLFGGMIAIVLWRLVFGVL